MTLPRIPFNKAALTGREPEYIASALRAGHPSGDGEYTRRCSQILEQVLGVPRALLTTSCTHALEISALLLDVEPGDEVIVPSFTFVSTVNAFVLRGARPIFADVRADTLNLDEARLEDLITPRTRAIVPVHYAGVGCEMDDILDIAARHSVAVVEDNAHGLFARYKGKFLGTFGCLATQSFHQTKNFSCGEGGALLINDMRLFDRAEIIREKGTDRARFLRGEVDQYSWVDLGSSYLPADIVAAFLLAQLEARDEVLRRRRRIWDRYYEGLAVWSRRAEVALPVVPAHCEQSYSAFHILPSTPQRRVALMDHLAQRGIASVFHYLPLHRSPMGERCGGAAARCPVTEDISARLLRLPFFNDLSEDEQSRVIEAVCDFS